MKNVLIMLSAYNRHKYIREQLDSLYAQKNVDFHILVRDDGSSDDTLAILQEYQEKFGKMTIMSESNIGVARSFHRLMLYASEKMPYFDYYAFSDQDDVWMEEKLAYAVQRLEYDKACLYYSNAYVTDSDLKIIGKLNPRYDISMQYVMFRQPTLGCTQVMTREYLYFCVATFRKFMLGNPLSVPLHDVWTIWLSQLTASAVIADDKSYMYYRQHDNNVTNHKTEGVIAKYRRVSRRLKREKGIPYSSMMILKDVLSQQLTDRARDLLAEMQTYKDSFLNTVTFAYNMHKYFKFPEKFYVLYRVLKRLY